MPEPYIAETQTAGWTSDAIREVFRDLGFRVKEWELTRHLEKQKPADSIFFSPKFSKLFGLQYKTLYHNGDDFWPIDPVQHETLQKHVWIYYCCSELTDPTEHGLALHLTRFYRPRFDFQPGLARRWFTPFSKPYMKWGAFYHAVKKCEAGVKITSPKQLDDLLSVISGEARRREVRQMREFFLADFDSRVLWSQRDFDAQ